MTSKRIIVDGTPADMKEGESVLVALLQAGLHPTGGGCLCCAGDCPHCLATVDGVSYVRTCQVHAKPGMVIERHHLTGSYPPLPLDAPSGPIAEAHNLFCDVVIIGQGESGMAEAKAAQEAGKTVIALDAAEGQEVIGIYPGPMVVARTESGMLHIHPHDEVVVATGAAEIQPVVEGNLLAGLVTARAATDLNRAGIDLGKVTSFGTSPQGVDAQPIHDELLCIEGDEAVEAVIVGKEDGSQERIECDTVSFGLGYQPRDSLLRMTQGRGSSIASSMPKETSSSLGKPSIRAVGEATVDADVPPCPQNGVVCPCSGVTVDDLEFIWQKGFEELELVKRATLAGTGTCQGAACIPYIRSFLKEKGEVLQPPFTARPVTRQLTIGEISAGSYHHATPRSSLDGEHRKLGAQMERIGGWWRPWHYGDVWSEYWAIREAVAIGDVSTLGKMIVSGPDVLEFLERLYPTKVATIKSGRARYVLNLNERGYVMDDGLICKEDSTRYSLTFTSGGATTAELWMRDWASGWGLDVHILNQTLSLGAINVTGPMTHELLAKVGFESSLKYMGHTHATVAGIDCKIFRLSFTGELAYELYHPSEYSVALWQRLLDAGRDLGVKPHGIEAMLKCRLEKGHIIVGQDTDFDSTPRRIHHEWAVKLEKPIDFIGKQAVIRTNKIPLDRQLVSLEMASPAPHEGAVIWHGSEYAGYVTSTTDSPILGKAVMLGWLYLFDGEMPTQVTIDGRKAELATVPFYDPMGLRAKAAATEPSKSLVERAAHFNAPEIDSLPFPMSTLRVQTTELLPIKGMRIITKPEVLEAATWPTEVLILRTAPDEALVLTPGSANDSANTVVGRMEDELIDDPHAIVVSESGFVGAWLASEQALAFLARTCEWPLPQARPAFAQGMVADLPVKLWFEEEQVLFLTPAPYKEDLAERISGVVPTF